MAGTKVLFAGLAVAAVATGSATAAMPGFTVRVHAHLAPVSGTAASGKFRGLLVRGYGGQAPQRQSATPRSRSQWRLAWRLSLPALSGPVTASVRVHAKGGAAPAARVLCGRCATKARGTMTLTTSQAVRIANGNSVVVIHAGSATLRGTIKSELRYSK